ncbi:hypothetical protein [Leifsonia sp. Leaf264]|uniref:hypothetical protein n=1 Tax=Leifsonia sp. Leaf264 TaxID=1736314 RepID=UPI0006FFECF4|nr:hypothetical protein [Leifsonia sp. Leaf264]KQO98794.1 hypothetical protein ASF30_12085 [Leifsonia sp. Leaf264]
MCGIATFLLDVNPPDVLDHATAHLTLRAAQVTAVLLVAADVVQVAASRMGAEDAAGYALIGSNLLIGCVILATCLSMHALLRPGGRWAQAAWSAVLTAAMVVFLAHSYLGPWGLLMAALVAAAAFTCGWSVRHMPDRWLRRPDPGRTDGIEQEI